MLEDSKGFVWTYDNIFWKLFYVTKHAVNTMKKIIFNKIYKLFEKYID